MYKRQLYDEVHAIVQDAIRYPDHKNAIVLGQRLLQKIIDAEVRAIDQSTASDIAAAAGAEATQRGSNNA